MEKQFRAVTPLFRSVLDGARLFARASLLDGHPETWSLARELYREVVRLVPLHVEARNNLGVLYHRLGDTEAAVATWRGVLDIEPMHAESHNNLGYVLQEQGRLEAASVHLLRAVESDAEMEEARFNLALCLQALGRPRAALEQWRVYLRRWPNEEYAPRARRYARMCREAVTAAEVADALESGRQAEKSVKGQPSDCDRMRQRQAR